MKWFLSLFCLALFLASPVSVCAGDSDLEPGQTSVEIKCQKNDKYSYFVRVPKTFDAKRAHKWPAMFIMSPDGGGAKGLNKYSDGADRNQFILAISVQSKNYNPDSGNAVCAMMDDVLARYPVDPSRCYSSGFSGGARMAFWLSGVRKKNIIGILPCAAGCTQSAFNEQADVYGLDGSRCFNRWDMTMTFLRRIKDHGKLRFFPAGHAWGREDLITEAMDWLNCRYMDRCKNSSASFTEEKAAFLKTIAASIEARQESKPEYAYEWSLLLAKFSGPEATKAKADADKLANDPRVKRYLEAEKAVDKFVAKYFNIEVTDSIDKPPTAAMTKDAKELAEKYKDTSFAETIVGFGEGTGKAFNPKLTK